MAYSHFDSSKPDNSQNGTAFAQSARDNLRAMRDMVVLGLAPGWDATLSGPVDQRTEVLYAKGAERLRVTLTWGTTGGATGNVTQSVCEYSADAGSTYSAVGTRTIAYDAAGNPTSATWS